MAAPPPLVSQFFAAMQGGAADSGRLLALFRDDAEYVESFSGAPRTHRGRDAIRAAFAEGWEHPLPDMRITVERVDVEPDGIVAHWTCHSPALPGGKGSGVNVFDLVDGRIQRLQTTLTGPTP